MQSTCPNEAESSLPWLLFLAEAGKERFREFSRIRGVNMDDTLSAGQCVNQVFVDGFVNARYIDGNSSGGEEEEGGGGSTPSLANPPCRIRKHGY